MARESKKEKELLKKFYTQLRWALAIVYDKDMVGDSFVTSFEIWIKETEKLLNESNRTIE